MFFICTFVVEYIFAYNFCELLSENLFICLFVIQNNYQEINVNKKITKTIA